MPKQKLIDRAIDIATVASAYLTKTEYDTVLRALRAAKKDKERLDWLAVQARLSLEGPGINDFGDPLGWRVFAKGKSMNGMGSKSPRQAIDAAMRGGSDE